MNPEEPKYISLQEATRHCSYSQEYLSLRARAGKLRAIKIGRNWVTTKEWLEEYVGIGEEEQNQYISLQEAAQSCSYSQEYLSLRARQGKLQAFKAKKNWVTTREWLEEYVGSIEQFKLQNGTSEVNEVKEVRYPENLPVEEDEVFSEPFRWLPMLTRA
jgi:hypothetical protein